MAIWSVNGGNRLEGSVAVQGAKNAVLPMLAASLLSGGESNLMNVPQLSDVSGSLDILRCLGCRCEQDRNDVYIDSAGLSSVIVPRELMLSMRSSVLFLGALLARCGEARLTYPGGCKIGARPIDLHLAVMRALGAEISCDGDELVCKAFRLKGTVIEFPYRSVGATENAMLAACGAEGITEIRNAAMEPEIVDLQEYLRKLGAYICGAGTDTIVIRGFVPEKSAGHRVIPDRIEAATLLCAAAATGGDIELTGVIPVQFDEISYFLNRAGCDIITKRGSARLKSGGRLRSPGLIETSPYPGFPTDAQPLLMAALLKAEGETRFTETVFENRFAHVREFARMGADITLVGRTALVRGVNKTHSTDLRAGDLRGGAALVIAASAAEGKSRIDDGSYIARGYEKLAEKLRSLGASIHLET